MFLEKLNSRFAIKKQESIIKAMSALDIVSLAAENYAISYNTLKGGVGSGRHAMLAGAHKKAIAYHSSAALEFKGQDAGKLHESALEAHKTAMGLHENASNFPSASNAAMAATAKCKPLTEAAMKATPSNLPINKHELIIKYRTKGALGKHNKTPPIASNMGHNAEPHTEPTSTMGDGHTSEAIHEAFNASGKSFGGTTSFAPNVMFHSGENAKANASIHEGALHGHLQDNGYKQGEITHSGDVTHTEYAHPNGSKVTVNAGTSGYRTFVGFKHTEGSSIPSTTSKTKPLPLAATPKNASAIGEDGIVNKTKLKSGLNKIANLTNNNDHNKALELGAKLIGRKDIADKARQLSIKHKYLGHMPPELIQQRSSLHDELHAHAKKVLSPEQAHSLYMSY